MNKNKTLEYYNKNADNFAKTTIDVNFYETQKHFQELLPEYGYGDLIDKYFKLGSTLNQRDVMAVRKTVSGLIKILYPNGEVNKEEVEEILKYALEGRRRVKEQLKRIGGMEFYAVNFSYIDNEIFEERYVGVPEQGSDKLIPEGTPKPGTVHTVMRAASGMFGVYRIEEEAIVGNGKFTKVGTVSKSTTDSISNAVNYFKANAQHISSMISMDNIDFMMDIRDLQGQGAAEDLSLATLIGMTSAALKKPVLTLLAVLGGISRDFGDVFIPKTVGVKDGDFDFDSNDPQYIMRKIREQKLEDSTVTIVLVGSCTHSRRYVDWEVKASLQQGQSLPNGLIAINLPYMGMKGALPPRVAANREFDGTTESGYARYYPYPTSKDDLRRWIEDAYNARTTRANLIHNSNEMMKYNAKCNEHGVTH